MVVDFQAYLTPIAIGYKTIEIGVPRILLVWGAPYWDGSVSYEPPQKKRTASFRHQKNDGWKEDETSFPFEMVPFLKDTVDGGNPANELISSLAHYLQGFKNPRWCRIFSII